MVKSLAKNCTLLVFLLITWNTSAQIENEIKDYEDSTELILNNGKKLLIKTLSNNDYEKATEIYYFLQEESIKQGLLAFSYTDILYINLLSHNYTEWLDYIKNYKAKIDLPIHPSNGQFTTRLFDLTYKNINTILSNASHLSEEHQMVIKIFLYVVRKDILSNDYAHLIKKFKKDYPTSVYTAYINEFLPKHPTKDSWSWHIGTTVICPTGKYGDNFRSNATLYMGSDFNLQNLYISLYLNTGGLSVKKTFDIDERQFEKDDRFTYFDGGVQLGYLVYRNNWLHIAPYTTIAANSLRSNTYYGTEHNGLELNILSSIAYGGGLHSMLKIYGEKNKADSNYLSYLYTPYHIRHYLALKVNIGYNIIANSRHSIAKGNVFYSQIGFVWGIGDL